MFLKPSSAPFGLDISDLSLKLVALNRSRSFTVSKKNQNFNLIASNQIALPPDCFSEGKIAKPKEIIKSIIKLINQTPGSNRLSNSVISVLPETKAFIKLIEIPNVASEKMASAILEETKNHFPFSPDEIYFDWQIINAKTSDPDKIKILVSVALKEIVNSYTELLIAAGLKPLALEIESGAICRALLPEEINSNAQENSATAIIDIGATRTSLIFYDFGTIQFTTNVPFSGQRVTEKISKKLNLTIEEAEKAKVKCGLNEDKCEGVLKKLLREDIEEMIVKIKNSFIFYQNHFPDNHPLQKILLCGGGSNFEGIIPLLKKELKINIESANPLVNIKGKKNNLPKNQLLSYTTAIGLALKGLLIN